VGVGLGDLRVGIGVEWEAKGAAVENCIGDEDGTWWCKLWCLTLGDEVE